MVDRHINFPSRFQGRSFQCLVRDHKVASCCNPMRCWRCNCNGHFSKHFPSRHCLNSRWPHRSHNSPARRSVYERLYFPDDFLPFVATSKQPYAQESVHLHEGHKQEVWRLHAATDALPCCNYYRAALLGYGQRGRYRSARYHSPCHGEHGHGHVPCADEDLVRVHTLATCNPASRGTWASFGDEL